MIRTPASVVALTRHAAFPLAVLVLAAMVLGLAPILVRLTETGPAAAGFWRFLFALPLLTLLTATQGSGAGRGLGTPSRWMLLAGLFFVLDLAFWHYGIVMTSVANATVLCNLTPVVVTLFAWVVWKQRPGRSFALALGLAVAGAFAMAAGADGGQGTNPLLGDLFSLSVAVWYAAYFLAVKAARRTAGASARGTAAPDGMMRTPGDPAVTHGSGTDGRTPDSGPVTTPPDPEDDVSAPPAHSRLDPPTGPLPIRPNTVGSPFDENATRPLPVVTPRGQRGRGGTAVASRETSRDTRDTGREPARAEREPVGAPSPRRPSDRRR